MTGKNKAGPAQGALTLDAEALYQELLRGVQAMAIPAAHLVGITSGGAWLAERLQHDLALPVEPGVISSSMHRDDFAQRGLSSGGQTRLPFDVNGAHIILLDDVLYTGRTIRAVINELFDYGRPARVQLAVLVDRVVGNSRSRPTLPLSGLPCRIRSCWPLRAARRAGSAFRWRWSE